MSFKRCPGTDPWTLGICALTEGALTKGELKILTGEMILDSDLHGFTIIARSLKDSKEP